MKKLSLIACGLIFAATEAVAGPKIENAFAEGKVSGEITAYHTKSTFDNANADSGFTAGTFAVAYETDTYYNFSVKGGFRAAHEFNEKNTNDFEGEISKNSVMNEVSIRYEDDNFALTLGRQEVDVEWIGDFNEAVIAELKTIPNTSLLVGYVDRQAVSGLDELSAFAEPSKDGVYFADVKNSSIDATKLNAYYYNIDDVSKFFGFKAIYSNDMFGIMAHAASSNEDSLGKAQDGSLAQVELSTKFKMFSMAAGYIKTDKDGGIGSMATYGDNFFPVDEGAKMIEEVDTKTLYASIMAEVADGIEVGAIYADTEYGTANENESELNLIVAAKVAKNLTFETLYISVDAENSTNDWDKIGASLVYSF